LKNNQSVSLAISSSIEAEWTLDALIEQFGFSLDEIRQGEKDGQISHDGIMRKFSFNRKYKRGSTAYMTIIAQSTDDAVLVEYNIHY
jgi:hypothetical protein